MSSARLAYPILEVIPKILRLRARRASTAVALLAAMAGSPGTAQKQPEVAAGGSSNTIRIAAASDLQTVMPTLAEAYHHATGITLKVSYGSSATLATQIVNGEPVDLFLGADYIFPEKVVVARLADERDPVPYGRGTLVLWARKDSPLQPLHMEALTDPRVKTVAIANAEHAPYGRAAVSALTKLHLYEQVKPKLVIAENIAQAGQFVESGNAQLGLISLTLAVSQPFKAAGTYVLVPELYPEIRQCAVVLAASPHRAEAHAFLDWLTSPAIQQNLPKLGLRPVD